MERYDRAITIFSPDGRLFQVDYAQEAVKKGSTAVAVKGKDCLVIGVEKKSIPTLQDERTIRKIHALDSHVMVAFAGLSADARVLIDRARIECESYKLTLEDRVSLRHISRTIADIKQKYTQTTGRRPFGISMLVAGFDPDGTPRLFKTEPSGVYYELLAGSVGRSEKVVKEYLEKEYSNEKTANEEDTLKLMIKSLSPVVQSGPQNIEIAVIKWVDGSDGQPAHCEQRILSVEMIGALLNQIESEQQQQPMETS
ncbi:Proteasome subunit alpha type-7 [Globodera pallida]|nr:Proteasome subunit alpha type-7 [Globodera pallida]